MKTTVNKSNRPPKSKWGLIVKIILTVASAVAGAFGIRSVPTLLFIPANGEPSMSPGAPSKAQLKQIIDEHLLK